MNGISWEQLKIGAKSLAFWPALWHEISHRHLHPVYQVWLLAKSTGKNVWPANKELQFDSHNKVELWPIREEEVAMKRETDLLQNQTHRCIEASLRHKRAFSQTCSSNGCRVFEVWMRSLLSLLFVSFYLYRQTWFKYELFNVELLHSPICNKCITIEMSNFWMNGYSITWCLAC